MTAMAFPVEIKVNVAGPAADALSLLALGEGSKRRIWFLEDLTPGLGTPLPLLSAGVLLRLRSGKSDDSTVKLRPCRRTQLTPEWAHDFQRGDSFTYRVEADWTGSRRSLAASAVQDLGSGLIDSVTSEGADAGILFDGKQQEFLRECGDLRVALAGLVALGPIKVRKWNDVEIGGLNANIERWTIGNLDFLEISFRSTSGAAEQQLRLEGAIRALGLPIDENPESKTRRVLAGLAGMASQDPAEHEAT
jgi:hypothetical protein